jgi:hypothetical protein
LIPDDLSGISACFSTGMQVNSSLELDLLQKNGTGSHLADYFVVGPPENFKHKSFIKKILGSNGSA